jgi:hypothetical protein
VHRAGDGGAVHPVEQGRRGVWELTTQDDQGGDDSVGEHQLVVGTGPDGSATSVAPAFEQSGLQLCLPGAGEFGDQLAEAFSGQAGADTMRQGRAGPS